MTLVFPRWPAATNLVTNGGFETNTTGWGTAGSGTVSITRTASTGMFGGFVGRVVCADDAPNQGIYFGTPTAIPATAGTVYSVAIDIALVSGSGTTNLWIEWQDAGGTSTGTTVLTEFAIPSTRTRKILTGTAPVGTTKALVIVNRITGNTGFVTYDVDGLQFEAGPIATPYIETNGITATRSAGRVILDSANPVKYTKAQLS